MDRGLAPWRRASTRRRKHSIASSTRIAQSAVLTRSRADDRTLERARFAAAVLTAFAPTLTDLLPWRIYAVISWPNTVVSALYPAAILMVVSIIRCANAMIV